MSKKSHNIINIISFISVLGVGIVSMALIIILSVFNGFEDLVIKMYNSFNPDIEVKIIKGKTFDELYADKIINISGIKSVTRVVEENALLEYNGRQHIVNIKGVSPEISETLQIDTMLVDGSFTLEQGDRDFAVVGQGVAYYLDVRLSDFVEPINVYVPKRGQGFSLNPESAFNTAGIFPSGIFSVQQDYDSKHVLVPLRFARKIMDYSSEVTSLEIALLAETDVNKVQNEIQTVLGDSFSVKDRFQQQELLYKIMKTEKWAIFFILTFILIIATTGIIGSLIMLILDKKKDIAILMSMGASTKLIKRIFVAEGLFIIGVGAVAGMLLGALICFLQIKFGLVKLGAEGAFVINAYPVKMKSADFVLTIITVISIGLLAIWLPVSRISQKYLNNKI